VLVSQVCSILFCFGYFLIVSYVYAQVGLGGIPPIYAFHIVGMTGMSHHTQFY
jgi:hypothetical protein